MINRRDKSAVTAIYIITQITPFVYFLVELHVVCLCFQLFYTSSPINNADLSNEMCKMHFKIF